MAVHRASLSVPTRGAGLLEITDRVTAEVARSGVREGLVSVFCRHTSCSLVIMENADPSARRDLERWLDRLVPADGCRWATDACCWAPGRGSSCGSTEGRRTPVRSS